MQQSSLSRRSRDNKPGFIRMTKTVKTSSNNRAATQKHIDDVLKQRQRMLVLLWELTKLDLKHVEDATKETLDDFLTILVDYIAAGHFGLYQRLAEGNERRARVLETAHETYPRIAGTTEMAVAFSERYDHADQKLLNADLARDLSKLAEAVSTRIELEDQLIAAMLGEDAKRHPTAVS
jgi:regulator of sigma D